MMFFPLLSYRCFTLHFIFFFNDTATTEIYTLSLHDALPICEVFGHAPWDRRQRLRRHLAAAERRRSTPPDRKSTRLNSSHMSISYAVFCLKKKKKKNTNTHHKTQNKTTHITCTCNTITPTEP